MKQALRQLRILILAYGLGVSAVHGEAGKESASWAEHYDNAEWVARLRIESVGQLINPAMSKDRLLALQGYRYSASVLESWKGNPEGTIRFQVDLHDCAQLLKVDQEYIVFGSSDYRGALESDSCDKIVGLDEAGSLPALLVQYKSKLSPPS